MREPAAVVVATLLRLSWLLVSSGQAELDSCVEGFVVHRDKIIRTQDSRKLGAEYLSEYEVDSKLECIRWCCQTERCDVFVYEEKRPGGCYLFHCGPPHDFKCKFTGHANYSSAVLTPRSLDAIDELKSLRKSNPSRATTPTSISSSSPPTSTASSTESSTASTSTEAARLPTSCSRNQFECRSSDDCIAIYNVCDGIPQCADGSDEALELGCPQERTSPSPPPPPPQLPQIQHRYQQQQPPGSLPDLLGYRQMMRLYPPEGPAAPANQQLQPAGWAANYQPRGYVPPPPPPGGPPQREQQQQAPPPQLQGPNEYERWPEQKLHAPGIDNYYPSPEQQISPRIFNHKQPQPEGRLEDLETPNGLYGQDPNAGYAPYYPAVIRQPDSWRDERREQQQHQQQQHQSKLVPATAAPADNPVPYRQPDLEPRRSTAAAAAVAVTSSTAATPATAVPCDSSEKESAVQDKLPATHSEDHQVHELQLKSLAETQLQERNSITIVDHVGRGAHGPSRLDDLDMSRPKGAVISLALGLSVTAIMAVLIACRLRVVKRRGRGRSHDSYAHDTDYLVNGMYL